MQLERKVMTAAREGMIIIAGSKLQHSNNAVVMDNSNGEWMCKDRDVGEQGRVEAPIERGGAVVELAKTHKQ